MSTAVVCRDLSKWYGATHALDGASVTIGSGIVHALVGENGAGKSTLLGVLAGRVRPDAGTVRLFGEPFDTGDPRRARRLGVAAIYQELTIVPTMSALANVFLDGPAARAGWRHTAPMRARFAELAATFGVRIDPDVPAGRLSVADQQLVEIMRAVQSRARLVLFDEPTASLAAPERAALYALVRRIRNRGVTVVLVSHNLDEVLQISDQVTVFRDGAAVATRPAHAWDRASLVRAMLGAPGPVVPDPHPCTPAAATDRTVTLHMRRTATVGPLRDIDLRIHAGELLGVAGLVGSGRSALLRELAGMNPAATGSVEIDGVRHRMPRSVPESRRRGLAIVPEDRKSLGLVPALSAAGNVVLSDLRGVSRLGWIGGAAVRRAATPHCVEFAFDPARLAEPVRNLSGGNQQKALLARWLYCRPRILLADEPTRGIDIGARQHIMRALVDYARAGTAVVLVCSEVAELLAHCDRVVVLARGRTSAEFDLRRRNVTEDDVLRAAFGLPGGAIA